VPGKFKSWWILLLVPLMALGAIESVLWWNHVEVLPPQPPKAAVAQLTLPASTSHLAVPVSFPTKAIATVFETTIPKSFPFDSKNGARAYGSPSRGPITVKNDVSAKRVIVSTHVSGRVQVEKKVIVNVSVGIDVSADINASFSPMISRDWKINPQLQLSVHVNRAVAKTAVGDIDITARVQGPVSDALNRSKSGIENGLASRLNVRTGAEGVWNKINGVHRLAEDPPTWLRITPRRVTFANFRYTQDAIESGLALDLETHIFLQSAAPELLKAPLPDLNVADALSDDFELSIPIEVSYAVINDQLKAQLSKAPFNLPDNAWVEITGATVDAYGDGLLLTADFRGKKGWIKSASGRLYIVGVPRLDPAKAEMRVEKIEYTAETKNFLLKNVEWLAHSKLLDAMKAAAALNLSGEMEKAKAKANERLNKLKSQLPKEVEANLSVTELRIDRLAFGKETGFVIVHAKGIMSARLQK
jgi:hypothetical protein